MEQNKDHKKLDHKKLNEIIALVEKAIPFAQNDDSLCLHSTAVFNGDACINHQCGTVHCFAGWAYIAKHFIKDGKIEQPKDDFYISYQRGVDLINDILGLELEIWAFYNPDIWKSAANSHIYVAKMAFHHETKRPDGAEYLFHIRDHLLEVSDRLKSSFL